VGTTAFGGGGFTAVLWRIVSSRRFAPVDNPLALQRIHSAEWLLSGEPLKESIFSWVR
jgi:hypothetical protein